jgi:hypothetical protein
MKKVVDNYGARQRVNESFVFMTTSSPGRNSIQKRVIPMRSETGSLPFFTFVITILVLAMLAGMGSAHADMPVQGAPAIDVHQD